MFPKMPVLKWEAAPTGVFKMAAAYADCRSQLGPLYEVEAEAASNLVEELCGPLRKKLQTEIDGLDNTFGEIPQDGPVVVFIRALALMGIVRKGKLRFL
ncbi:MAG: hypothetical protein ACR2IE_05500 [Candidatus Sumerlaeaceae bacterium]